MPSPRIVRVALLLCDTPLPEVQAEFGNYLDIYRAFLGASLASLPSGPSESEGRERAVELVLDGFDVIGKGDYPERRLLEGGGEEDGQGEKAYDAVMLTGSKHTAHDDTLPWLAPLIDFVRAVGTDPALSYIKLIGVCFGMQIIARAMGGTCVPNPAGWEIGVYDVELAEAGAAWIAGTGAGFVHEGKERVQRVIKGDGEDRVDPGEEERKVMRIQQMHRDHIPALPPSFALIGSSPKCPVQGFLQYYPAAPESSAHPPQSPQRIHILGVQGHPEFLPRIVQLMVDVRSASGVLDGEVTAEARRRQGASGGGDGRGVIGWGIWRVLLGEA